MRKLRSREARILAEEMVWVNNRKHRCLLFLMKFLSWGVFFSPSCFSLLRLLQQFTVDWGLPWQAPSFHSPGGWKSEVTMPAELGSGEGSPPGLQTGHLLALCPHGGERQQVLWYLFLQGCRSHCGPPTLMIPSEPHFPPKALFPNAITLWLGLQHTVLGGHHSGHCTSWNDWW